MQKYFSKTEMAFYDDNIYRLATDETNSKPPMPTDVVAVSSDGYTIIRAALNAGGTLAADANGNPIVNAAPAPSAAELAFAAGQTALAEGIQITSATFPAINGTYGLTATSLLNITGTVAYIGLKNQFPGGASSLTWYDAAGVAHSFTTVAEFDAFAEAVASFIVPIQDYINSGGTAGALPTTNAVTIV